MATTARRSPHIIDNVGSTARDFCMMERNFLAHLKLALLLSLLSSSVLLRTRLVPSETQNQVSSKAGISMAAVQTLASLIAIGAGIWEYRSDYRDLRNMRAFLVATKGHFAIMCTVAGVIFATCIVLLADYELL